jgi:hypothetical protein
MTDDSPVQPPTSTEQHPSPEDTIAYEKLIDSHTIFFKSFLMLNVLFLELKKAFLTFFCPN